MTNVEERDVAMYRGSSMDIDADALRAVYLLIDKLGGAAPLASLMDLMPLAAVPESAVYAAESMGLIRLERRGPTAKALATALGFAIMNGGQA